MRGIIRRLLAVTTLGLVVAFAGACDRPGRDTIERVAWNPDLFAGMTITVQGTVQEIYGPRVFTIANEDLYANEMLVLAADPGAVGQDAELRVTGTVRRLTVAEVQRDYGFDFGARGSETEFTQRLILVADSVERVDAPGA